MNCLELCFTDEASLLGNYHSPPPVKSFDSMMFLYFFLRGTVMYKIHPADKSTSLNLKQPEFYRLPRWLVNTEWEGKTSQYLLLRDGFVESPLKEGPIFIFSTNAAWGRGGFVTSNQPRLEGNSLVRRRSPPNVCEQTLILLQSKRPFWTW